MRPPGFYPYRNSERIGKNRVQNLDHGEASSHWSRGRSLGFGVNCLFNARPPRDLPAPHGTRKLPSDQAALTASNYHSTSPGRAIGFQLASMSSGRTFGYCRPRRLPTVRVELLPQLASKTKV